MTIMNHDDSTVYNAFSTVIILVSTHVQHNTTAYDNTAAGTMLPSCCN